MMLDTLRSQKTALQEITRLHGATRLRVFGSVARRQEQADSDVDFLVELPRGYDLFRQRLPLTQSLSELLHKRVDLIPEHELNPHIRASVLAEAIDL